jgi:catechol 2,3-dioxygenase-like lactoylglutathione lyase family enzyme
MPVPPKTTGPMSPPRPTLSSVAVVVSDRAKAVEWYTKKLGLDLIASDEHWVTVGRKGQPGVVHLCQWNEFEPGAPLEPGNSGIAFHVGGPDFSRSCAALKARGVKFAKEPTHESWGWHAEIEDPDGNVHSLAPGA